MSAVSNSANLAMLDVLSCGLGGTVLLFLIFASLGHQGAAGAPQNEAAITEFLDPAEQESTAGNPTAVVYKVDIVPDTNTVPWSFASTSDFGSESARLVAVPLPNQYVLLIPNDRTSSGDFEVKAKDASGMLTLTRVDRPGWTRQVRKVPGVKLTITINAGRPDFGN
jgi:hypothetical protein